MGRLKVFHEDGPLLGEHVFIGQPLVGDCFLMSFKLDELELLDVLLYIKSRRWNEDGTLELIVSYE